MMSRKHAMSVLGITTAAVLALGARCGGYNEPKDQSNNANKTNQDMNQPSNSDSNSNSNSDSNQQKNQPYEANP